MSGGESNAQWLLLAELCEQDIGQLRKLLSLGCCPETILEASEADWREAGLSREVISNRRHWRAVGASHRLARRAQDASEVLKAQQAQIVVLGSRHYPPLLAEIYQPPPLLYVTGRVESLSVPQFAVVGSRRCSASGARAATEFADGLSSAGFSVCSGLALGIDAAAHRAALAAEAATVAVMATGIDLRYPGRHEQLARAITDCGALVTEFAPGTPPRRQHFPRRNRLISGMSVGVLVVEAGLKSGSLITARLALEQNREVFAVPHSIYHPGGRGCLHLLRQGAALAETVDDLLSEVGALCEVIRLRAGRPRGSTPQPPVIARAVWSRLGYEPASVDELVKLGAGDVASVVAALQLLELEGLVERCGGSFMRRV